MVLPQPVQQIATRLECRWGIDVLWLFGSQATGFARQDSDWDIAVLFRTRPEPVELQVIRSELEAELGVSVDIVDLERASPVLARQVVKHGRLLVENDRSRRIDFVAHVPGRYEDLCIVRHSIENALLERIRHG